MQVASSPYGFATRIKPKLGPSGLRPSRSPDQLLCLSRRRSVIIDQHNRQILIDPRLGAEPVDQKRAVFIARQRPLDLILLALMLEPPHDLKDGHGVAWVVVAQSTRRCRSRFSSAAGASNCAGVSSTGLGKMILREIIGQLKICRLATKRSATRSAPDPRLTAKIVQAWTKSELRHLSSLLLHDAAAAVCWMHYRHHGKAKTRARGDGRYPACPRRRQAADPRRLGAPTARARTTPRYAGKASQTLPMPSSTASSTTPTACSPRATACEQKAKMMAEPVSEMIRQVGTSAPYVQVQTQVWLSSR